ncbi:hypothetical protein RKE29_01820 [Streptomyces sp. B1866]|uniref:hypothetical protein n=1 Tax=Streptomyces sp. B1866 TaxID=3075431 RepID=UPI00288C7469|nr:hypothetical protein [Streptomyces sp. B1866]MDT3395397.1 hypothetical protein [Streptomyces sp. B1866]
MVGRTSSSARDAGQEAHRRLDAYTYLSAPERLKHLAIMRVFCGSPLADPAVPDVLAKLGIRLTVRRTAGARCVLHSIDGDLLLDDLELEVGRTSSDAADGDAEVSVS